MLSEFNWLKIQVTFCSCVYKSQLCFGWCLGSEYASGCWASIMSLCFHWGLMTHICISKLTTIGSGSDNGVSPCRRQATIWTNVGILLIGPLGTNFSEIVIEMCTFSFRKMHLKMSSGKWRQLCIGLNVLNINIKGVLCLASGARCLSMQHSISLVNCNWYDFRIACERVMSLRTNQVGNKSLHLKTNMQSSFLLFWSNTLNNVRYSCLYGDELKFVTKRLLYAAHGIRVSGIRSRQFLPMCVYVVISLATCDLIGLHPSGHQHFS